mgnify:CR=1 FL=1
MSFEGADAISYAILQHIVVVLSDLLLPYNPRKASFFPTQGDNATQQPSTASTSTFTSYAIKLIQKAQEEKMSAMSVQDYQITVKILTVLKVHVGTLQSKRLKLWGEGELGHD